MNMQTFETRAIISKLLYQPTSLSQRMSIVINQCREVIPHADWPKFGDLPFDEVTDMQQWLRSVLHNEPPPLSLKGLWFGLFNPVYGGRATSDIYVAGTTEDIEDPHDIDWACDPDYWPEQSNAHSKVLESIYRLAYSSKGGLRNNAEYPLCLAYGAFVVKQLLDEMAPGVVLRGDGSVLVAVGFDDGDYLHIGAVSPAGFYPTSR